MFLSSSLFLCVDACFCPRFSGFCVRQERFRGWLGPLAKLKKSKRLKLKALMAKLEKPELQESAADSLAKSENPRLDGASHG